VFDYILLFGLEIATITIMIFWQFLASLALIKYNVSIFLISETKPIRINKIMQQKSFRISNKTTIHISTSGKQSDLEQPLYAINWFNTKSKKLYNLYAALAFSHVKKVGGEVVFKGKVKELLSGDKSLKRESLLIVKYPSADGFLALFSQKMFLIKSLLRVKAVKDFVFGFVKMTAGLVQPMQQPKKYTGNKSYLVHIVKEQSKADFLTDNLPEGANLFFDGLKTATVGRSENEEKVKQGPFFIERIIIWEGEDHVALESWINSKSYPLKQDDFKNHGIYFVTRLL